MRIDELAAAKPFIRNIQALLHSCISHWEIYDLRKVRV